ncbi:MAG: HAD-IA family hydrolase [Actinobacteria bacterium]|nr:HAD-IA family hydrolase [Actinomycetota bacterium]
MIDEYDAYLFDLDGVLTPTVLLHRRAWQRTFDELFVRLGEPPYRESEYFDSLDGRPRFEGVAALLSARGIRMPEGDETDDGFGSVRGIGNRKNLEFNEVLARDGIEAYPGSLVLLDHLAGLGKPLAVVSSSRNAAPVLRAAGLLPAAPHATGTQPAVGTQHAAASQQAAASQHSRFAVIVDGVVAEREGLPGKPAPDTFLRAAELLGSAPERSVVFEDAGSGVAAGRAGGFGLVVGVDRGVGSEVLRQAGADTVVHDLDEVMR